MDELVEKTTRFLLGIAYQLGFSAGIQQQENKVDESQLNKWIQLIKGQEEASEE